MTVKATKNFSGVVQTASALVNITVNRNLNSPFFSKNMYNTSLLEDSQLGTSVVQLTASDNDLQVRLNIYIKLFFVFFFVKQCFRYGSDNTFFNINLNVESKI